jgi:hypothetical protein
MKKLAILASVAALAAAASVHASAANRVGIHWGEARPLGAGTASAWVAVDIDGSASSMGVSIDEAAMQGAGNRGEIEALLPLPLLPKDVSLAGATARTAFRVRYDRERRTYLVMLDGFNTVAAAPGALSAQAVKR